jgi:hypothetical protein
MQTILFKAATLIKKSFLQYVDQIVFNAIISAFSVEFNQIGDQRRRSQTSSVLLDKMDQETTIQRHVLVAEARSMEA